MPVADTAQQFLSIPVYTIFKNLTIILIVRAAGRALTAPADVG
jgi:uncharacterized protein YllA (UPF0747 family)